MLQHEFQMKLNVLENIPHVSEWCDKAGVTLQIDVKAGYSMKNIVVDEAKAIGAYHIVLDRGYPDGFRVAGDRLTGGAIASECQKVASL